MADYTAGQVLYASRRLLSTMWLDGLSDADLAIVLDRVRWARELAESETVRRSQHASNRPITAAGRERKAIVDYLRNLSQLELESDFIGDIERGEHITARATARGKSS